MKFKKLTALLLTTVLGIGALTSCSSGVGDDTADTSGLAYVSLRINPEIELIADEDGIVVSANAVNDDGEVVLTTVDLVGSEIDDAAAAFAESSNDLGYVKEGETDTVYVGVEGASAEATEELKGKLDKSILDYFNNNGINGKVSAETLEKYAEKAESWGVSKGHAKLVMRALDANPDFTDEEILKLSVKEIMNLIKGDKNEEKIAVSLRDDYRAAVNALKVEYEELFSLRAELETLEAALEAVTDKSQKDAIEAQIDSIEDQIKEFDKEYKSALSDLKDTYKELSKEARKAYQAEAKARQDEAKKQNKNK